MKKVYLDNRGDIKRFKGGDFVEAELIIEDDDGTSYIQVEGIKLWVSSSYLSERLIDKLEALLE